MNDNKIIRLFKEWLVKYEKGNGEIKDLMQQRMSGFITALELSGKNVEANKCKVIYKKLTEQ